MKLEVIKNRNKFFLLSLTVIIAGIIAAVFLGFKFDIDFKGGTTIEANLKVDFKNSDIEKLVKDTINKTALVQKVGTEQKSVSITTDVISNEEASKITTKLKETYKGIEEPTLRNIQPSYGKELIQSAVFSVAAGLILILIYIFIRFRALGMAAAVSAIIALVHDTLIMIAVYAIFRIPLNSIFVAAILTVIGYSINDTIIVYDRIRDNKRKMVKTSNGEIIDLSTNEMLRRCLYTSLTTVICAGILFVCSLIYNQSVLRDFAFPLMIGVASGTYSSLFIASPLWYVIDKKLNGEKVENTTKKTTVKEEIKVESTNKKVALKEEAKQEVKTPKTKKVSRAKRKK